MKDPAFLFYSSDFLNGVSDLTMEERGQFITLLCLQHLKGGISEKTIRLSVGSVSVDVLDKFRLNKNGEYENARLAEEIEKRSVFTESRRNNGKKGGRPPLNKPTENHMDNNRLREQKPYGLANLNHMENENENVNVNENREIKGVQGEKERPHHTEVHDPKNGQFVKTKTNDVSQLVPHPSDQSGRVQYEIVAMNHSWSYPKLTEVWETWVASRQSNEDKRFNRTEAFADFRKFCLSYAANERSKNKNGNHSKPTGKIIYAEPD